MISFKGVDTIANYVIYIPFILKFHYIVEDRRPDLTSEQAAGEIGYKYKTMITFKFLWYSKIIIVRSLNKPYIN